HVKVGDEQIVDLPDPGITRCGHDAVRVAGLVRVARPESCAIARPTRVDEQGMMLGGHDERRLPALDVNEINLKRLANATRRRGGRSQQTRARADERAEKQPYR